MCDTEPSNNIKFLSPQYFILFVWLDQTNILIIFQMNQWEQGFVYNREKRVVYIGILVHQKEIIIKNPDTKHFVLKNTGGWNLFIEIAQIRKFIV